MLGGADWRAIRAASATPLILALLPSREKGFIGCDSGLVLEDASITPAHAVSVSLFRNVRDSFLASEAAAGANPPIPLRDCELDAGNYRGFRQDIAKIGLDT